MNDGIMNKKIMSSNLKTYMDINKKSRNDICKDLGFSYSTFADWVNGNVYPRIDKIEILAKYFGVDKSDLIEDKARVVTSNPEYTRLTNLCSVGFKSVLTWTEDVFYTENETIALRDHFSNLLYQYKDILESLNGIKIYWNNNKADIIEFYKKRDASLTDNQIKEMLLRQELTDKLNFTANLILNMPEYIVNAEERQINE